MISFEHGLIRPRGQAVMELGDISGLLGSGIYGLGWRSKVVYIGQAKQLWKRVYSHCLAMERARFKPRQVMIFSQLAICPCPVEELNRLEKEMIELYKPKYNTQLVPKISLAAAGFDISSIKVSIQTPQQFRRLCQDPAESVAPRLRRFSECAL